MFHPAFFLHAVAVALQRANQPVPVSQVGRDIEAQLLAEDDQSLWCGTLPQHRRSHVTGKDLGAYKYQH